MYIVLVKVVAYKVFTVKIDLVVLLNHAKQLRSTPPSYYFSRSDVNMNAILKSSDQIFPQAIPSNIDICLVRQREVNGDYTANPLNL